MPPEQAVGEPVDKRRDIGSFGVALWEMRTGKRLFESETISHTLAVALKVTSISAVFRKPPRAPSAFCVAGQAQAFAALPGVKRASRPLGLPKPPFPDPAHGVKWLRCACFLSLSRLFSRALEPAQLRIPST
jgi:hypothetical protein